MTKNTDHMIATVKATGSYYQNYTTNNKIDLTGYELVGIEYSLSSTNTNPASAGTGMSSYIAYTKSLTGVNSSGDSNLPYYWKTNATRLVDTDNRVVQYYQIDTTSTIKDGYLTLSPAGYYANTTTKIYKIWLQ